MKRCYLVALRGIAVFLVIGSMACGEETFRTDTPKVKSTMKSLDEYLNKVEEALTAKDLPKAVSLVEELEVTCERLCNLDISDSKLSNSERVEFKRLREDFHYRVERLETSAEESSLDVARFEFEKVRQSCVNCHKLFKKNA